MECSKSLLDAIRLSMTKRMCKHVQEDGFNIEVVPLDCLAWLHISGQSTRHKSMTKAVALTVEAQLDSPEL